MVTQYTSFVCLGRNIGVEKRTQRAGDYNYQLTSYVNNLSVQIIASVLRNWNFRCYICLASITSSDSMEARFVFTYNYKRPLPTDSRHFLLLAIPPKSRQNRRLSAACDNHSARRTRKNHKLGIAYRYVFYG